MPINSAEKKKYDYFISYSNADSDKVEPIVELMSGEYKAKCWFQLYNSKHEYVEEIISGIENSSAFIVFISKYSALSNNVLNEIHYALSWADSHPDYTILPVVIDNDGFDINDEKYRKVRFYLNRFNMLFLKFGVELNELVIQIFGQTNFVIEQDILRKSLYHTSESEAKRLKAQNEILKKAVDDIFPPLVTPKSVILDVGCAGGDNIVLRLSELEYGRLLGVDIDPAQIALANKNYGSDKNEFIQCDITDDSFYDVLQDSLEKYEVSGFDLIHVSAVLLHQTEPVKILRVLRRFLKSSGHLFIQDEDDGANIVYPNYSFFNKAFTIWLDSKESGDRFCARKIPAYLKEAGYHSVSLKKCGISNIDVTPDEQEPFWDIYFNYKLWEAVEEDLFYNPKSTQKLLDEYIADYEKRHTEYAEGKIFIQLGFLFYVAKK